MMNDSHAKLWRLVWDIYRLKRFCRITLKKSGKLPINRFGFDVSDGEGRLQGQVANGSLEATIASAACEHRWTMRLID